ncbi:AP3-complex subunit beta-A isoform X2 [Durio zibethinus]|uniref:AP-3 complex subunit beta n=1 Tax=Durio zibethinus TaxID=66656 RepID=A0A6P6AJV0_DURZI|nr:AP3-complex subunit beta-A isoform X2 [Durio zibethinus]
MFPQFGATAESLSKASTMVFRIGTDAHLYDDPDDVSIAPLLDSKFDSEKCEALKRLLALIAQGFDVSNFFPQVVKNVASQSLEVKKLVYLYLLHYAEKRPNEALLSINCFQKDLGDPNPLVRAWALRTMAGIRLHVIAPLVLVAVGKCARDPSVYVRKCAANALPKLHDLRQEEHTSSIEEIVGILLNDHSPAVVGAAAAAFASVCPYNLSLIGRNYRKLCEILPDVEEWGQIVLIGILLRYVIARHGLVKESIMCSLQCTDSSHSEKNSSDVDFGLVKESRDMSGTCDSEFVNMVSRCYIEGPDEYLSRSSYANRVSFELNGAQFTSGKSNDDVKILLCCTSPLLWSNNSAVVLAAASVHWVMAPKEDVKRIIKPLLFILRSSNASKYVDYIRDPDRRFAADTVAAIGQCVQRLPKMTHICVDGLLALIRKEFLTNDFGSGDQEAGVLVQAIMSIKSIIKQDPPSHEKVIIQLVRSLDSIKVPAARAMIIWMVGEYSSLGVIIPRMLTTVLKYLAWCFTSESLETKLQILNTASKVLLGATGEDLWTFKKVFSYLVELAECDLNYDVRDRAHFLKKLQSCNLVSRGPEEGTNGLPEKDLHVVAEYIFGRQRRDVKAESINYRFYLPGSLSQIVLHAAPGYEPLPKPCSLLPDDLNVPEGTCSIKKGAADYGGTDGYGTSSGSSDDEEESASAYGSQRSITGSSGGSRGDDSEFTSEGNDNVDPLIQISDIGNASENENGVSQSSTNLVELMSNRALESWLDEQPGSSNPGISEQSKVRKSSARISIGDVGRRVKPKSYSLLDPANGNGLKVDYSFSSEISSISHLLVCIEVFFKNCSSETVTEITLVDEESNRALDSADQASVVDESSLLSYDNVPTLVPMEEIASLEPGQTTSRILQVRFHHHLLPLKLALFCDGKKLPVKLRPDIGYFVKPLPMDVEVFMDKESHLRGMFEYTRSCTFTDHIEELNKESGDSLLIKDKFLAICESLALKMLSNANLCLVSVDMPVATNLDDASGLRLRFSCEILSSLIPCLITITVEGKCSDPLNLSIKVNCEQTVFGLNLLNRIVNFLVECVLF